MTTSDLVYVGIKGSVVALNRRTGETVWATHLKGSDFVNVTFQGGLLLATCSGEIFALHPLNGNGLWHNQLKGMGTGLATIALEERGTVSPVAAMTEKRRRDAAAAAAAAA